MSEKPSSIEPQFEMRDDIRRQRHIAERLRNDEINGEEQWDIYDSADFYATDFSEVIPARIQDPPYIPLFSTNRETPEQQEQRIADFRHYLVDEVLKDRIGEAVGIDFGGPGRNFFADYPGVFERSLGVVLYDHSPRTGPEGHSVIEGDMLASKTHRAVNAWLGGEQADFIMERVAGGQRGVSWSAELAVHTLSWWYSILREGGVMFLELPFFREEDMDKPLQMSRGWAKHVNQNYKGLVSVNMKANLARINKHPGAPEKLPLLPS